MDTEEKLTIEWLNDREPFDNAARSPVILSRTLSLLTQFPQPAIADLGSGTGNNLFYLLDHLPCRAEITLVEQHSYLLEECRARIRLRCKVIEDQHNLLIISQRGYLFTIQLVQDNFLTWMTQQNSISLYTCSALLDLLTKAELKHLLHTIADQHASLYSTLNYSGVQFSPTDPWDTRFIRLFEEHMSRELDRGKPLGSKAAAACHAQTSSLLNYTCYQEPSSWNINNHQPGFIQQNIGFYESAIRAQLSVDGGILNTWLLAKNHQIKSAELTLKVNHNDLLITASSG